MSVQAADYPGVTITTAEFSDAKAPAQQETEFKVYKRRWLFLAIFVVYSTSNAMQWIQYSIIANVAMEYYGVSSTWIDWTSMIYMITYIPLIFPASWILDKWGLRVACLIGSAGTCLGAWIKLASVSPDRFYVAFIGHSIVACSQVFVLSVPARLAAVWFGPDQVSSACSIGVFGNQLGVAIGFLFPPMIVKSHEDINEIGADLQFMYYIVAGITSLVFIAIITIFQAAPPLPPSSAQAAQRSSDQVPFLKSVKKLITNSGYILLLVSYGINVGVFYAISTLLNQVVLVYFPGKEEDAGRIGLTIVVAGMVGSVICGIALDKTHKFKEVTLAVYAFSLVGMLVYTFTLQSGHIAVVYFTGGLLGECGSGTWIMSNASFATSPFILELMLQVGLSGFFMTGYLPVGFEFAAELTYPEPEGTSAGLLNASSQVFGILFTIFYSFLFTSYGDLVANGCLSGALLLGAILTALIRAELRRQKAHAKPASPVKEKF